MCTYAVLAEKTSRVASGGEESSNRVLCFEDGSMEQIGLYELDRLEQGLSCVACVFDTSLGADSAVSSGSSSSGGGSSSSSNVEMTGASSSTTVNAGSASKVTSHVTEYFVVGTAHVVNNETEPSRGRILVFEIAPNRRVHLIAEKEVKCAVFSLANVCGRLAAGMGSKVLLTAF